MAVLRRTIRLRLTLLYGTLFLATGAVLLVVTYGLAHALPLLVVDPPDPPVPPGLTGPPPPALSDPELPASGVERDPGGFVAAASLALAFMTVVSVGIGWLVAGRMLRPLRSMTATARAISARDLHRRLAVQGPEDEIKGLGDTFDALLGRLEAAFEAQRRFVANASHELRTPLTLERSLLEVVLADPDASAAELRAVCERVLAGNEDQARLIEALLMLARGQRGLDGREPLDLAKVAGPLVDGVEAVLDPAPASGDPRLLERLAANLIDNARRHNVPGGWTRVRTGLDGGRPMLRVTNTGPVIDPEQVGVLLQPFQRLEETRTAGTRGSGLGLSIVAAIAAAHDAELDVRPRPGGGLDVRVLFTG